MPEGAPDAGDPAAQGVASPPPGPAAAALTRARELLKNGDPAAALAALGAARPEAGVAPPDLRPYLQLQALCRVAIAAEASAADSWWDAFGLDGAAAGAADVRRQFRRLAALVHPDKGGSAQAFAQMQDGLDALLEALDQTVQGGAKRRRQGDSDSGGEGDEFAWWTEWDDLGAERVDDAEKEAKKAAEAADEAALAALDAEPLAAEVRARQGALLGPLPPGATLSDLKAALWRARGALAAKLQAAADDADPHGGGFLPHPP